VRVASTRLYRRLTRSFRRDGDHTVVNRKRFMLLAVALLALNTFFWIAPGGFALSRAIIDQYFGSRMIRAEVVVQTSSGTADYLIDRGTIKTIAPGSVVLKEKTGEMVTIQLAATATVTGAGGRSAPVSVLRRGMRITVFRLANAPADSIQVEGVGP
jgi:hypothetical protein